jgi:hypothetical protein
MRALISTVAPSELPGYSAEKRSVDYVDLLDFVGIHHRPALAAD